MMISQARNTTVQMNSYLLLHAEKTGFRANCYDGTVLLCNSLTGSKSVACCQNGSG